MIRLSLLCFIVFMHSSHTLAIENYEKFSGPDNYISKLNLPYDIPHGCQGNTACSLSEDFNGDGKLDYAGLYEYMGERQRRRNRYIDLIIVYSQQGRYKHEIFTHVGQIHQNNKSITVSLARQKPGNMRMIPGERSSAVHKLDTPAINVISNEAKANAYFPTFYWSGNGFNSMVKSDD